MFLIYRFFKLPIKFCNMIYKDKIDCCLRGTRWRDYSILLACAVWWTNTGLPDGQGLFSMAGKDIQ